MKRIAIVAILLIPIHPPVYSFEQVGIASYYADKFHGRPTASGKKFSQKKLTAAHRTLPFGTKLKVTRLKTGKSVIVKVNDRGPFVGGRVVDLSRKAARKLGILKKGLAKVRIEVLGKSKDK